jgi:hypothetical protein
MLEARWIWGDEALGAGAIARFKDEVVAGSARDYVTAKLEAGRDATGGIAAGLDDLPLFASSAEPERAADPLADALGTIDPDALTPREALETLYRLKRLWAERGGE